MAFPKTVAELEDKIVKIWRATIESLRQQKADKSVVLTINGVPQDISQDRTWTVTDANLSTSDITTNDVSITKHGFAPKAPNDATRYLDGTGAYSVPPSGGGEDLAATLAIGNTTGGTDIDVSAGDNIIINDAIASRIAGIGASKEVLSLDTATYPSLAELAYVKGVTSNIQTQINTITPYPIFVQQLNINPGSGTTVYFGRNPTTPATSDAFRKVYLERGGTITFADIVAMTTGTVGTNENISLYIRHNNTTDYLIATVGAATNERRFTNTGLSITVASGDWITIKIIYPVFGTPPNNLSYQGILLIT